MVCERVRERVVCERGGRETDVIVGRKRDGRESGEREWVGAGRDRKSGERVVVRGERESWV